jgi:hypothetical protein
MTSSFLLLSADEIVTQLTEVGIAVAMVASVILAVMAGIKAFKWLAGAL